MVGSARSFDSQFSQHVDDTEQYGVRNADETITEFESQFCPGVPYPQVPSRVRVMNHPQHNVTPQQGPENVEPGASPTESTKVSKEERRRRQ